jgi:hypothetical protein
MILPITVVYVMDVGKLKLRKDLEFIIGKKQDIRKNPHAIYVGFVVYF